MRHTTKLLSGGDIDFIFSGVDLCSLDGRELQFVVDLFNLIRRFEGRPPVPAETISEEPGAVSLRLVSEAPAVLGQLDGAQGGSARADD